jgi:hypothetical protein
MTAPWVVRVEPQRQSTVLAVPFTRRELQKRTLSALSCHMKSISAQGDKRKGNAYW